MTIIMNGVELRTVFIGSDERLVPAEIGVGDDTTTGDLLEASNYCEHGVYRGPEKEYVCPWE